MDSRALTQSSLAAGTACAGAVSSVLCVPLLLGFYMKHPVLIDTSQSGQFFFLIGNLTEWSVGIIFALSPVLAVLVRSSEAFLIPPFRQQILFWF